MEISFSPSVGAFLVRPRLGGRAARPARASLIRLRTFEHRLHARDLAVDELEDLRVQNLVRLAHPLGHREAMALIGPALDVAATHEIESREDELPLLIDDREVGVLVA